ncbi:uncharacterized protein LOC124197741 isoform X2 [Daphnia pulex]|uniref:uncharacterized protein LOC124197741 isoform X2 n=1 Tax=Daphnia pulex TaxID=6669 RepID=UPI001EDE473A|nr:uncharacterized protein LOC124197741 isoform X2 [Daphnia pulex]
MSKLCFGEFPFNSCTVSLLRSDRNGRILKWNFKGKFVAVKKLLFNSDSYKDQPSLKSHWEKLVQLRDEHLIQYLLLSNVKEDDVRYLVPVMDWCGGSMLDYCRGILDKSFASLVKSADVMWQITCGLDFLHRHKIDPGNLKSKNVLFWKKNSKSRQVVVKLTEYGYSYHRCEDKIINLAPLLGCLFYSAATKEETGPNGPFTLDSLTEIDVNHRVFALDLISLLINRNEGRIRLTQDLMEDKVDLIWSDTEKLQNWLESLDEKKFLDEDFNDFKDIFLEWETQDSAIIRKALKTPQLLSEYIWHTATESKGNYKPKSIKLKRKLGEGKCGTFFECEYITDGSVYLAACKKCKPGSDEDFNVEIKTLRKLSHLFVVKYLDVVTMNSEKFIVMELCEGSLKDYAEGNLKEIPKDSLDEKILLSQVALGLAFIHDKGIIHKDLKLHNILLKRQSNRLVLAKIADFGFAKELKLTWHRKLHGT